MSAISAALKSGRRIEYLIEIDFSGLIKRYALRNIAVSGRGLFEAAILDPVSVGSQFDLSSLTYSLQSVAVSIANKERLQDEAARRKLDGATGKIYVWAEGLSWSDIEPAGCIMSGRFQTDSYDKHRFSFTLAEQIESQFQDVPPSAITPDTWPSHRTAGGAGSVAGKSQSLVLGSWARGIPLLCVDTAAYKYVAMHGISQSTEADYNAGTVDVYDKTGAVIAPAGYTFYPGGVDGQGNVISYFDFTGDQASLEPLSCSIAALVDGSGEITGTAATLIEHPADIIYYLLRNHTELLANEIDVGSLRTMRTLLPGLKFASIVNSPASSLDVIDRILQQCSYSRLQRGGKFGVSGLHTDAIELSRARAWGQIGKTVRISATPDSLIVNDLIIKYALNPSTGQYEAELRRDRTSNDLCKRSFYDYGRRPAQTIELPDVQTETTAAALAARYLELHAFRHDIIERETPVWEGIDVLEGDCGLLTCAEGAGGWTDEPCILLDRQFNGNTILQRWWRIGM